MLYIHAYQKTIELMPNPLRLQGVKTANLALKPTAGRYFCVGTVSVILKLK